jgi:isopenicillin N synthase-like dioxygenase
VDPQPPVIDIQGLVPGDSTVDPRAIERVARDIESPCRDTGVFQIVGHGVPQERLDAFTAAGRAFFELPAERKRAVRRTRDNARGYYDEELTKNRPDWKEVFDYGAEPAAGTVAHSDGVNQWPEDEPALRRILLQHYADCERVALALLRALCASLGLDPHGLDAAFVDHSSFVRLNLYRPCPDPAPPDAALLPERGHLGVHHHTDAGALTLVLQDDVAGLQVLCGDRFVTLEPVRGAFAVHLADMFQVWSNDLYRSPVHRVLAHAERPRFSAPFFLNPSYRTTCAPLPEVLATTGAPLYRPVSWAHFRDQRSAGDYADYGAEIQIEHFRLE